MENGLNRLVEAFRRALKQKADTSLIRYENDIVEGFKRMVESNYKAWSHLLVLDNSALQSTFEAMWEFVMKEVYPKTALARLEREIAEVKEEVKETVKEAEGNIIKRVDEDGKELAGLVVKGMEGTLEATKVVVNHIQEAKTEIKSEIEEVKEEIKDVGAEVKYRTSQLTKALSGEEEKKPWEERLSREEIIDVLHSIGK